MNIGFDLDGVFIDKPPFIPKWGIELLYRERSKSLSYRFPGKPEQLLRKLSHKRMFRPLIKKNIDVIINPKRQNKHAFFLISARFSFLQKETENLLSSHRLKELFDATWFNVSNMQPHLFKENVIKKLTIHRYVDDDLELLMFLSNCYAHIKFFWLNKKKKKVLAKNLFAIQNLSDVFR
ncbi:MAG: hypothetical protein A3J69_01235 [Candidatus Levybacteria bacterium RIFCSPHIGHO2_02_FULL_42_12]|nr:MAG: hypothetical protein A3J69_01235 [Candidatus Levybacteria bacterium RIFCSPHIGHO2_02_FULL_42_12]OGH42920.1 MAG: hypothetical protein A3B53_00230 [Candidatus Levybacteria bacterium RIFCSPLOWO2_01_FULL_42_15]